MRLTIVLILLCFTISGFAQENPQITQLSLAVERNPENVRAHDDYLKFFERMNPVQQQKHLGILNEQYDKWIKRYPKSYILPLCIGKFHYHNENPAAKQIC